MDTFGGVDVIGSNKTVRRKRSNPFRRPRDESEPLLEYRGSPSQSSTPTSVSASKASSDDNNGPGEENLRSTPGHPKVVSDASGGECKVRKVKLKLGGVTHTLHTRNSSDGSSFSGQSLTKSAHSSYAPPQSGKMLNDQGKPDGEPFFTDQQSGLQGIPWKSFSKASFGAGICDPSGRITTGERIPTKQSDNVESARKSKRAQKKLLSRGGLDDDDDDNDDEIRYLKKLKSAKFSSRFGAHSKDDDRKNRTISGVLNRRIEGNDMELKDYNGSGTGTEGRKLRLERTTEDTDYAGEEESASDIEPRLEPKEKKQKKETSNLSGDSGNEMAVTTRRRALMSGSVSSAIEFPNGLPPVPSKKQKDQLSEVEQQLKRAEALQRRRIQVEKANRESEAEAIRKILGQDSSRKKREEKVKKQQEERAASFSAVPSDAVRWVIGSSGTVVIFPEEIGLPSIFEQKSCSYPPAREKCVGPSCLNDYKYRDSKSKLPLCSLGCYKAIHEKSYPLTSC